MLNSKILNDIKQYTTKIEKTVTFVINDGNHEKRIELEKFLSDLASVSNKIKVKVSNKPYLRSAVSFTLLSNGQETGVIFSGIPGGHEFSSLIIALLQAGGGDIKLDDSIKRNIKSISRPLKFTTFVSLSCHNCPDVVQSLNKFALLNKKISNETIDGSLYPELIEKYKVQGVPAVFLNDKPFINGKISTAILLDKLLEKYSDTANIEASSLPEQDLTVIGGGPAGITAAIYAARKGLTVTIIADRVGGQVKDTMDIENFISIKKTTGSELSTNLAMHLDDYNITKRENLSVISVQSDNTKAIDTHKVTLNTGEIIITKTLVIATGAKWKQLGIPGELENIGNGVAYCPHCDGPFFKGKDVAVIGGGNSGVEAAIDLSGIVKHVSLFEFMPELKADKILQDQLYKRKNITVYKNTVANKITNSNNGKVNSICYTDRTNNTEHLLEISGVFVQIGLVPNSDFLAGLVKRNKFGEIIVDAKGETSKAGIFACGDVTTVPYKQIIIAMGEGAKASLAAFDYLLKR